MPLMSSRRARDGMTPAEAVWAATAGGASRAPSGGRRRAGARRARRPAVLDAPTRVHLAYRPGVPLVDAVYQDGVRVA